MAAPSPPRNWSIGSLRLLKTLNRGGATLGHQAEHMGVTPQECDLALWALLGRSPEDASLYLRWVR